MNVAHLHPILVHFALGWSLFWVVRDLLRTTRQPDAPIEHFFLPESVLVTGILGIATGWLALAWDDTREFRGHPFWPGAIHEALALLAVGLLGALILKARWFWGLEKRGIHLLMAGILLTILLLTGMTGEWLVFGWGATGRPILLH